MTQWQPSACLITLRPNVGKPGFEVLLAQRAEGLNLAPGHHVFPGGAVELIDGDVVQDDHGAFRQAALREFNEEVCQGVPLSLALEELIFLGEWRAPAFLKKRYLTRFYIALAEPAEINCDGVEIVAAQWYCPEEAVNLHTMKQIKLMFPTLSILDWLASFSELQTMLCQLQVKPLKSVCPELKIEADVRYLTIGTGTGYRIERWRID